jgi:transposase
MRKGFDGLFGIARDRLGIDPLSGHLFVFCNWRRNRLKVLYWDGSGLWICSKRLEKGRFSWPTEGDEQGRVRMSSEELTLLVSGIELSRSGRKDWYRKEIVEAGAEKSGD